MSSSRPSIFAAFLGLALLAGCSSGQSDSQASAEGDPSAPPPAAGDAGGTPPAPGAPAETPPGTPAAAPPEKPKEPEKTVEKEPPPLPQRIEVDVESLTRGLQSSVAIQVFTAGEYFRQIPVAQRREVLLELSNNPDANVRGNAWRVFTTIATKDDLATLSEALQNPNTDVRIAALETMARFPNDETVAELTKRLENPDYRQLSVGLLSKIGPTCEAAVLPYATHADPSIRRAAWDVLANAGSRKSVQALEQLTTLPQYQKEEVLKRSLEQLRERLRKA